ncbi:hypothetical protein [Flavobacterium ajazii]|uniref:hypothetical protein n=1 Tax=Flavobacterium ajazii TaxID=2692318 RepID=UPI0013CF9BAB|nr:hypothetical protein [Flavobacterium ajazii]
MIKIKVVAMFLLISASLNAQKADTKIKTFTIPVPKSEFFNSIKKYSIIVQGSDRWSYSSEHAKDETFEKEITLDKYKNDTKIDNANPDIKILVGYTPTKLRETNAMGQTTLEGDFSFLFLSKNNEIIYQTSINKACVLEKSAKKTNESDLANTLCGQVYELLDTLLITANETKTTFNYGNFEKCDEFPELVTFNTKTAEMLTKLEALSFEDAYLDEMQNFYKGYIGKQFGKMKDKDLNKVIYLNLSLIEIFKVNFEKANEYLAEAKQGAGLLSLWPDSAKKTISKFEFVNQRGDFKNKIDNLNSQSVYYISTKGTAYYKKKIFVGEFYVPRFKPTKSGSGGIMSLDSYSPNIMIFENGKKTFDYPNGDQFNIKTEGGKEISFKKYNGEIIMVEKNTDGTYKPYESISSEVYTSPDNEKLELKKA